MLVRILDAEADDNGIQKGRRRKRDRVLAEVIAHAKMQFISTRRKCLPGQNRAVIATIIIGDAVAQFVALTVEPVERPGDPGARPTGRCIQYMSGQLSHRVLLEEVPL